MTGCTAMALAAGEGPEKTGSGWRPTLGLPPPITPGGLPLWRLGGLGQGAGRWAGRVGRTALVAVTGAALP